MKQKYRKIISLIILISLVFVIGIHIKHTSEGWGYTYPVLAQQRFDLACPIGNTQPFLPLTLKNPQTDNLKANACVDPTGLITWNSAIGGGVGTGGGGGSTGQVLSGNTFPGMFLGGPIPTANGAPAVLENSSQNIGILGTQPSISAGPLVAASTAIYTEVHADGSHALAPDGTWTVLDANTLGNGAVFYKPNLGSTNAVSIADPSGTYAWTNSIIFVGGNISSIPHTVTLNGAGGCATFNWCFTGTLATVSANNQILVVITSGVNSNNPGPSMSISDSQGNAYQQVANIFKDGNQASHYAFLAQSIQAGSPVITVRSNDNTAFNFLSARAYELAGATSYYAGSQGPYTFRYITPQDLGPGIFPATQTSSTVLGADVTVTTIATTIAQVSVTMPASGCPCRVFISYSGYLDYTGVTNEPNQNFWVNDGVTSMAGVQTGQSNASTGASTSATYGGYSTVLYSNGQAVTFGWLGIDSSVNAGTQNFKVKAAPAQGGGPNSTFQITIIPNAK